MKKRFLAIVLSILVGVQGFSLPAGAEAPVNAEDISFALDDGGGTSGVPEETADEAYQSDAEGEELLSDGDGSGAAEETPEETVLPRTEEPVVAAADELSAGEAGTAAEESAADAVGAGSAELTGAEMVGESGSCGNSMTWKLENGVLTISGTGVMRFPVPWKNYSTSITGVVIEEGVKVICPLAFDGCKNLTNVTLPSSLTLLGSGSFQNCKSLTSITIPAGVNKIYNSVFSGCNNLTTVSVSGALNKIYGSAFRGCESLTAITIPEGTDCIESYTFSTCRSLTDVKIPDSVLRIDEYAFYRCRGLKSITIPQGVLNIGSHAFDQCLSAESLSIPDSVTTIGEMAFANCLGLSNISIPDSVTTISEMAFANCKGLTSISIPRNVSTVETSTFYDCKNLQNVFIPDSVTKIGQSAFKNCVNLKDVYFAGTEEKWKEITIDTENEYLTEANIHYNAEGIPAAVPTPTAAPTPTEAPAPTATPTPAPTPESVDKVKFTDVTDPSLFYYDAVYWAAERGFTTGYGDNTFRPMEECSRVVVVTFLWRLAGRPQPAAMASFTDMTGNSDFDNAISWALEKGITTGYKDNTFRPWVACHRAAIVTFMWRYAGKPQPTTAASFTDMTGNGDFNSAISWASENNITTGYDEDNTFRPWNICNRLAIVCFMYRYASL